MTIEFLRNAWYVAAWPHEVDRPVARTVLDEALVLYRGANGDVVVLEDRCPHRTLPLSMGTVEGDALRCAYHGLLFDRGGACLSVPSQDKIPTRARVRAYPAVERFGWIWVWMGEAEQADPALIPELEMLSAPGHRAVGATNAVAANYQLITDNLMDLSHVGFVHASTIGNAQMGSDGELSVERTPQGAKVTRWVRNCLPPPTYLRSGRIAAGVAIDRWQIIEFVAPSCVRIHVGGVETGKADSGQPHFGGFGFHVINAMTPETQDSTNYYWAIARDFAIDDSNVDELFLRDIAEAFNEDKRVIEAQQRALHSRPAAARIDLVADAGAIQARRALDQVLARERAAAA